MNGFNEAYCLLVLVKTEDDQAYDALKAAVGELRNLRGFAQIGRRLARALADRGLEQQYAAAATGDPDRVLMGLMDLMLFLAWSPSDSVPGVPCDHELCDPPRLWAWQPPRLEALVLSSTPRMTPVLVIAWLARDR